MCEEIGYEEVFVDMSNSEMQFEIDEDEDAGEKKSSERTQIHGGNPEFRHLADYDINSMCARVTVYGKKPMTS